MKCGDVLEMHAALVRQTVVLIAPFIKTLPLQRLLTLIDAETDLTIVTRWRPDEVAVGVSDLDVFDVVANRPRSRLRLCDQIHAKIYRFDNVVLVGSANLTGAALGWSRRINIELLCQPAEPEPIFGLIDEILTRSVEAIEEIRDAVAAAAACLEKSKDYPPDEPISEPATDNLTYWAPTMRNPEGLWRAYIGDNSKLIEVARQQADSDLSELDLPMGLDRAAFEAAVSAKLMMHPLLRQLDDFVLTAKRFGAVSEFVGRLPFKAGRDPSEQWQTIMRWLLHFLPERYTYSRPRHSEVFARSDAGRPNRY